MTSEDSLYSALTGAAGVAALVGTRVYPDIAAADAAMPALSFSRIATEYLKTIHGGISAALVTFDIYCLAATREAADALAEAVQTGIVGNGFEPTGRRTETDGGESESVEMTVLTVEYWEL